MRATGKPLHRGVGCAGAGRRHVRLGTGPPVRGPGRPARDQRPHAALSSLGGGALGARLPPQLRGSLVCHELDQR